MTDFKKLQNGSDIRGVAIETEGGICVGFMKNGEPLIAHCSATQNKVVVSTCGSEFKYFRRPCSVLTAN